MSGERVVSDNVAPAASDIERLHVVCAWCKKVLHQGAPGAETSHGICEDCKPKAFGFVEVGQTGKTEFLA